MQAGRPRQIVITVFDDGLGSWVCTHILTGQRASIPVSMPSQPATR